MSRTRLGVVFLASVAIGAAAVTMTARPLQAGAFSFCQCVACTSEGGPYECVYSAGNMCYMGNNGDICATRKCPVGQPCI
jgi:hypothetical protein